MQKSATNLPAIPATPASQPSNQAVNHNQPANQPGNQPISESDHTGTGAESEQSASHPQKTC